MAAPTPTARQTPTSTQFYLKNGFRSKITIRQDPAIILWEKAVTPPGVDGGAPVEVGNMFSVKWNPQVPRGLATMTPARMTCAYDPKVFNNIVAAVNREDIITLTFPNNDTLAFFGYLQQFIPNEISDGNQPTASVTLICTMFDGSAQWGAAEQGPVWTAAS
jgi:hypothetical protein